jgi:hypothetical protein
MDSTLTKQEKTSIYIRRTRRLAYYYMVGTIAFIFLLMGVQNVLAIFGVVGFEINLAIASFFAWAYIGFMWFDEGIKAGQVDKLSKRLMREDIYRGLIFGLISFIILIITVIILSFVFVFFNALFSILLGSGVSAFWGNSDLAGMLAEGMIKIGFSPVAWITQFFGNSILIYFISGISIPILYVIGYVYGIRADFAKKLKNREIKRQQHVA